MKQPTTFALALSSAIAALAANPAFADHPSVNGAGWANMPNDIHNTRVHTRDAEDDDAFLEFVQYGAGADTVNRFLTTTTSTASGGSSAPSTTGAGSTKSGSAQ